MAIVPVVGGIIKVGGTLATAKGINELVKLLPLLTGKGVANSKKLLTDKIFDYALNQLTGGSGKEAGEKLKIKLRYYGFSSIKIQLSQDSRIIVVVIDTYPPGFSKRFADADGDPGVNQYDGVEGSNYNKFDFGGVSFGASLLVDATEIGDSEETIFNVGLYEEIPLTFSIQAFTVPKVAIATYATFVNIYVLPFVDYKVFEIFVKPDDQ